MMLTMTVMLFFIYFSIHYFSATKQAIISYTALAAIWLLNKFEFTRRPPWRFAFIVIAFLIAVRYIIWRTTETLVYTQPLDFTFMMLLYAAEVYTLTIFMLSILLNLWPLRRKSLEIKVLPKDFPSVDVLIPTYSEEDDIIRITVVAATQIDYPKEKLNIYICDDGGTVAKREHPVTGADAFRRYHRLQALARELGVHYLTREDNTAAKAGNLNAAMQHAHGDLVLVLDCDHVPTHDILQQTVGFFIADPKLFLVQTPHFFINPTPVERSTDALSNISQESDLFFREIHRSLDFWNASYFCGSAAVLRRKLLDEVGGIAGQTITEDAETSFQLHSRGYNSLYYGRPMVCGLSPENYSDYFVQRSRWAQGMIQLLIFNNPLFTRGLSFAQRLCYFNFSFYWFFGLARIMFLLAPILVLMFHVRIYFATPQQVLTYVVPYIATTVLVMNFFYRRARRPFFSEVYECVQSAVLALAALSVLFNPRKPTFKVTPKEMVVREQSLNPVGLVFVVLIVLSFLTVVMSIRTGYLQPIDRDALIVTGVWAFYNMLLAITTLGAFWERRQHRAHHRIAASESIEVAIEGSGRTHAATTLDLSLMGIRFRADHDVPLEIGQRVTLQVRGPKEEIMQFQGEVKRLVQEKDAWLCGVKLAVNAENYDKVVSYLYGNSDRWLKAWQTRTVESNVMPVFLYWMKNGLSAFVEVIYLNSKALLLHGARFIKTIWQKMSFKRP